MGHHRGISWEMAMKTFRENNVVYLVRRTIHVTDYARHICGICFTHILPGERYVCHVYVSNRKVSQHKVHLGCHNPNPLVVT